MHTDNEMVKPSSNGFMIDKPALIPKTLKHYPQSCDLFCLLYLSSIFRSVLTINIPGIKGYGTVGEELFKFILNIIPNDNNSAFQFNEYTVTMVEFK